MTGFLTVAACGGGGGGDDDMGGEPDADFVPATHENMMIMRELHGIIGETEGGTPIQALRPAIWLRSTPVTYHNQLDYEDEFGIGCAANTWDLDRMEEDRLQPIWGDLGSISITGWSGSGGGEEGVEIPEAINCQYMEGEHEKPYQCTGVPDMIVEGPIDNLTPASMVEVGDKITYTASGGPASRNEGFTRTTDETVPGFTITSPDFSAEPLNMETDWEIVMDCPDAPRCGPANAAMFLFSDNPDPFGKPIRWYQEVWCSYLADDNTIAVSADKMQYINETPWESVLIEVFRMKFPTGIFPVSVTGSASGYFYAKTRE